MLLWSVSQLIWTLSLPETSDDFDNPDPEDTLRFSGYDTRAEADTMADGRRLAFGDSRKLGVTGKV